MTCHSITKWYCILLDWSSGSQSARFVSLRGRKQRVECRRTCKLANLHGKKQHDHDYIHFPVLVCFHLSADTWSVLVPSLYTIYSFHWFICACSDSLVKTVAYYLCRPHEVTQLQIQLDWISSVVLTRANQDRPNLAVIN